MLFDGPCEIVIFIEFYLFWSCKPDCYAVISIAEKITKFLSFGMINGGAVGFNGGAAADETYVISDSLLRLEFLPMNWRRGG